LVIAAVDIDVIVVIALFADTEDAVATCGYVAWFDLALRAATVAAASVGVIALFARIEGVIPAEEEVDEEGGALAGRRRFGSG
jgi:hypothetical protein